MPNECDICHLNVFINRLPGTIHNTQALAQPHIHRLTLTTFYCATFARSIAFHFHAKLLFFAIHVLSVVVRLVCHFHLHTQPVIAPDSRIFVRFHINSPLFSFFVFFFFFLHFRNEKGTKNEFLILFVCDVFILIRLFFPLFVSILLCNLLLPFEFFPFERALHCLKCFKLLLLVRSFAQLFGTFFLYFVFIRIYQ